MSEQWKINPPPLGRGNPWFVDSEDGEHVAIIPITTAGRAESIAKAIVADHNAQARAASAERRVAELLEKLDRITREADSYRAVGAADEIGELFAVEVATIAREALARPAEGAGREG